MCTHLLTGEGLWRQSHLPPRSRLPQPKQAGRGAAGASPCVDSCLLSLPVRDPPHSPTGPLPSLHSLTCVGQGRGWEGPQALKGKLLKPLGQEVAERGCFLWQSRGAGRAGPISCSTACLLWALRGRGEPGALLSLPPPHPAKWRLLDHRVRGGGASSEEAMFILPEEEFGEKGRQVSRREGSGGASEYK